MAATTVGRRLTEQHRLAQLRISALTVARMRVLWRLIDPTRLDETTPGWLDAASTLVAAQAGVSAALARRYYRTFRAVEAGAAPADVPSVSAPNRAAVETSLLVTGPYTLRGKLAEGVTFERANSRALAASAAAAARQALTAGRNTLVVATDTDRRALGWQRVTSIRPCAFCAMLAGRGPAFKNQRSASFQAHDSCACTAEPVFARNQPPPPQTERFAALYDEAAKGQPDPLNAFRRAYEGRQ